MDPHWIYDACVLHLFWFVNLKFRFSSAEGVFWSTPPKSCSDAYKPWTLSWSNPDFLRLANSDAWSSKPSKYCSKATISATVDSPEHISGKFLTFCAWQTARWEIFYLGAGARIYQKNKKKQKKQNLANHGPSCGDSTARSPTHSLWDFVCFFFCFFCFFCFFG